MKVVINTFAAFACTLLVSCSSSLKVTSDYNKKTDFSKYKTFAIDTSRISQRIDPQNAARLISAVKSELIKKGFTENNGNPDLRVGIAVYLKKTQSTDSSADYAYGGLYRPWVWGGDGMGVTAYSTYNVENYRNGSLIIDIADANTKSLLWEGIGNTQVEQPLKNPETFIPATVSSTMAGFPPGKK